MLIMLEPRYIYILGVKNVPPLLKYYPLKETIVT